MKITMTAWALVVAKYENGYVIPTYYYNKKEDVFQKECTNACIFVSESEAEETLNDLGVEGLHIVSGKMSF